jgi:hypothetical protein
MDGLEETRAYQKLKEVALDHPLRRNDFGMKRLWTCRETDSVLTIAVRYLPKKEWDEPKRIPIQCR